MSEYIITRNAIAAAIIAGDPDCPHVIDRWVEPVSLDVKNRMALFGDTAIAAPVSNAQFYNFWQFWRGPMGPIVTDTRDGYDDIQEGPDIWSLHGWYTYLNDSSTLNLTRTTEEIWQEKLDSVIRSLSSDVTIASLARDYNSVLTGIQVLENGPAYFCGESLCHFANLTLTFDHIV